MSITTVYHVEYTLTDNLIALAASEERLIDHIFREIGALNLKYLKPLSYDPLNSELNASLYTLSEAEKLEKTLNKIFLDLHIKRYTK